MKKIISLVLVMAMGTLPCLANNDGPDAKHVAKVKQQVGKYLEKGDRVTIETYDQRKLQGAISEANDESFVITVEGRSATLNYNDVKKIKAPMSRSTRSKIVTAAFLAGLFGFLGIALSQDK